MIGYEVINSAKDILTGSNIEEQITAINNHECLSDDINVIQGVQQNKGYKGFISVAQFIEKLAHPNDTKEFCIGDIITLDRYNHIEDVVQCKIIGHCTGIFNNTTWYEAKINDTNISFTGRSIMESKFYLPVPDYDRHYRVNATAEEIEEYWNNFKK